MIGTQKLQAAVISKLKASTAVTGYLGGDTEIKETSQQSTDFTYPNVRVAAGIVTPESNLSGCYLENGEATFTVSCFSENDSSKEADELMELVNDALLGSQLSGSGFRSLVIQSDGLNHAQRTSARVVVSPRNVWAARGFYRAYVYETS